MTEKPSTTEQPEASERAARSRRVCLFVALALVLLSPCPCCAGLRLVSLLRQQEFVPERWASAAPEQRGRMWRDVGRKLRGKSREEIRRLLGPPDVEYQPLWGKFNGESDWWSLGSDGVFGVHGVVIYDQAGRASAFTTED